MAREVPPVEAHAPHDQGSVLIVEDETELAQELGEFLERQGFRCSVRVSVEAAAACLRTRQPAFDLLLCDVFLNEKCGLDLVSIPPVRHNINTYRQFGVIAYTGGINGAILRQCVALGVDDVLMKPFSTSELLESIQRVHALTKLRRAVGTNQAHWIDLVSRSAVTVAETLSALDASDLTQKDLASLTHGPVIQDNLPAG